MLEEHTPARINRRVLAGAVGGTLVSAAALSRVLAQESTSDDSATPEADTSTTGESTTSDESTDRLADHLAKVREEIAAVQADRDAVAGEIDVAGVDELIALATSFADAAETAAGGDSIDSASRFVRAADDVADAAGNLISAQLAYAGLPSQDGMAVRNLSSVYDRVVRLTELAAEGESAEASDLATRAQTLYATAYDLYNQEAFAQAIGWGKTASNLASAGLVLLGEESGSGPGSGGGSRGGSHPRNGDADSPASSGDSGTPAAATGDTESSEPESVPAPDF